MKKVFFDTNTLNLILEIEELVGLQDATWSIIRKVLKSNFNDFEDAI